MRRSGSLVRRSHVKLPVAAFACTLPLLGGGTASAQAPAGVPCRSVSVLAVWATPAAPLTVLVNGSPVGTYDDSISVTLDGFLKPGTNTVGFSYPAVPRASTDAALKCQPPGGGSKATILLLKPSPEKLQAQTQVSFTR